MLRLQIDPERLDEFEALMAVEAPRTRGFDGCELFEIYRNQDASGEVVFLEHWVSDEKSRAYGQWRADRGDFEVLGAFFTAPPITSVHRRLTA
jgi:quinol monooxygenase YgiN